MQIAALAFNRSSEFNDGSF